MHDRSDERNRGEFSGHANFGGNWARDAHYEGMGDDYARDGGWSGGGAHDDYTRDDDDGFRGRGPKKWTADERLRAIVNERLTEHHRIDATDIDVTAQNGEVTLTGTCRTRTEKRLAEDVAWNCGVHDVHNRLTVTPTIGKASE